MKRRTKFKPGDLVRIENPLHVARVGYPLTLDDMNPAADACLPGIIQALEASGHPVGNDHLHYLTAGLKKALLKSCGYGGRERTIHTEERPHLKGQLARVEAVRYIVTGTYHPDSSWGGYDEPAEYDPAYLGDPKRHRLLKLNPRLSIAWGYSLEIEDVHVTLVEEAS